VHYTVNRSSDMPVPEVLVTVELGKVVDIELAIGNAFD
jgi:hypothetical protein